MNDIQYITRTADASTSITRSRAHCIVLPCNIAGSIHPKSTLAQIERSAPELVQDYKDMCANGAFEYQRTIAINHKNRVIIFAAVKDHPEDMPSWVYLNRIMKEIIGHCRDLNITSIAMPKLGCGSHPDYFLSWRQVGPLMVEYLRDLQIPVRIYVGKNDAHYMPAPVVVQPMPNKEQVQEQVRLAVRLAAQVPWEEPTTTDLAYLERIAEEQFNAPVTPAQPAKRTGLVERIARMFARVHA